MDTEEKMIKSFDKKKALTVCNALISICIESGAIKEGSIMHTMGKCLMDYIRQEQPPGISPNSVHRSP